MGCLCVNRLQTQAVGITHSQPISLAELSHLLTTEEHMQQGLSDSKVHASMTVLLTAHVAPSNGSIHEIKKLNSVEADN
jgi:hypothetical protein